MKVNGRCDIGFGSRIVVGENAMLEIEENLSVTAHSTIICMKRVVIGKNVLISWDVLLMDSDFHYVGCLNSELNKECSKEIAIGNHVWIGCRCTVLKGAVISDDTVIAANSVVTRKFSENNVMLAGNPAIVKHKGIQWRKN